MDLGRGKLVTLFIGIVIFILFLYFGGLQSTIEALSASDPLIFLVALGVSMVGIFSNSLTWYYSMKISGAKIPFFKSLYVYSSGIIASILLPIADIPGDLTRIYLFKENKKEFFASIKSAILCRLCFAVPTVTGLSMFLLLKFFPIPYLVPFYIWPCMLLALLFLFFLPKFTILMCDFLRKIERIKKVKKVEDFLGKVGEETRKLKKTDMIFYWSMGHVDMFFDILTYFFSLLTIGVYPNFLHMLIAYVLITYFYLIPIPIPGGFGVTEGFLSFVYLGFNIPLSKSLAAAIVTRVVRFWFPLLASYGIVSTFKFSEKGKPIHKS